MKYDNYQFDHSTYHRPNGKHNCGRRSLWKKGCWQGPDHKGRCGGTHECTPARSGDRYQCTRPVRAGGRCEQGPLPDGSCCNQQVACRPTLTLRSWRSRLSYLTAFFVIALIIGFAFQPVSKDQSLAASMMTDPGLLSRAHHTFTGKAHCESCHTPHQKTLSEWLLSAFNRHDLSPACSECHRFQGDPLAAHHKKFDSEGQTAPQVECVACHTEHKGSDQSITEVTNHTCSNCHQDRFVDFAKGHPDFSARYPYQQKQTLYFDHSSHIDGHFIDSSHHGKNSFDETFANQAANSCITCHDLSFTDRSVKPKPYEQICQSCHEHQITGNPLVLMTIDEVSPTLLGLFDANDEPDAEEIALQLIDEIKSESLEPLFNLTGEHSPKLWQGLNPFEAKQAAEFWAEEEDHEKAMEDSEVIEAMNGWQFGENEDGDQAIYYKPVGHNDALIKAWIEYYLNRSNNEDNHELIQQALDQLLDKQGPGACGKCHAAGLNNGIQQGVIQWGYVEQNYNPHVTYNHQPHIDLMGKTEACQSCHKINHQSDFASYFKAQGNDPRSYESTFMAINKHTCSECHSAEKIRSDCLTCHQYHGNTELLKTTDKSS